MRDLKRIIRARQSVVATWAIGLLLLALLWFSFTAVSVQLEIEPEPDEIELPTSLFDFHIGDRYLLRPGTHQVVAEKQGYQRLEARIEVTSAASQQVRLALVKLPGLVRVTSRPAAGASVRVDGEEVGVTPLEGLPLQAGRHAISVHAPRHLAASREVEIEGGGVQQGFEFELVPAWAPVSIDSDPAGARVWIDGVDAGATPGRFEIDAGTRRIELRLEGYRAWSRELEVLADQPQVIERVALAKADAHLRIESTPADAQVIVDEVASGRTPIELEVASGVAHEISLFKSGHELATRSLELEPNQQRTLHVRLTPRLGSVELITRPDGATLLVDGKGVGVSGQPIRLLAVPQTLVIRKDGYEEKRVALTPTPDLPQRIEVELARASAPASRGAQPAAASPGRELALVRAGSFVMGSRRGEPDRRPNESERAVQLTRDFYIGAKEVTNAEFRRFAPEHAPAPFAGFELGADAQPAVRVAWRDAARYCNWLSEREGLPPAYAERGGELELIEPIGVGYRLPTEAEWTWAARFAAGASNQRFAWGDQPDPPPRSGNYADASAAGILPGSLPGYHDGFPVTAPVGIHGANAIGLFDVGGNVAEWVHDRYKIYAEASGAPPVQDPTGPPTGGLRVIRGSSWKHANATSLRLAFRDYGDEGREDVGFRVARYAK